MEKKFLMLHFYAVLSLHFICDIHAEKTQMSNCKPNFEEFKFWNCRGTTATFDAKAHQKVNFTFYVIKMKILSKK